MAKRMVKCPACGKTFDANSEQAVQVGARRYGHASCYPENTNFVKMEEPKKPKVDNELQELKDYIKTLFGDEVNWARVNQQIKQFQKDGYSLSGIKKSLVYFYEVKHNSLDKAKGSISIVPFVYQDAYNYYYGLFMAQQATQNKEFSVTIKDIIIRPPKMKSIKKKFFNLGGLDDEE